MGKSNRIRSNRATREVRSLDAKKPKKGMPSWMMTAIAIVLTLAILLSVVGLLLASNGVFNRWAKAVSTKHFKVNANMMSYYFQTQYQNFVNQYGDATYISLDPTQSLKSQRFGGPENPEEGVEYYDKLFLGDFEGTWFDYFMDQTVDSVSNLLVYCEAAYERDVELEDEDYVEIDANLASISSAAISRGYTNTDAYISALYGPGVKEKDIRKAMEYSALATKAMSVLSKEIGDGITETQVNDKFAKNFTDYTTIDFCYYDFKVTYADAKHEAHHLITDFDKLEKAEQEAKILEIYKEKVAEADAAAKNIADSKTSQEATELILAYIAQKEIHTAWDSKKPAGVTDADRVQTLLSNHIADEVSRGKTTGTKPSEHIGLSSILGSQNLSDEAKTAIDNVHATAFKATLTAKDTYVQEKAPFVESDDVFVWAYEAGRAAGDTKIFPAVGVTTDINSSSSYSVKVCYLIKTPYCDQSKTRSVAYMLFSDEEAAHSAAHTLAKRGISTLEAFEALADELGASAHTHLDDYVKGSLNSTIFDAWAYAENTKVGDITEEPLTIESGTYCVALYYGEGKEAWYVEVKNEILSEEFDNMLLALSEKYDVKVNKKALNRIDA